MYIETKELQKKSNEEIIQLLKQYPYPSKWENKEALFIAEYTLAKIQGNKYLQTGNINSFRKI